MAVIGKDNFDVSQIDISSILLSRVDEIGGSVEPNAGPPGPHSVLNDVGTPFANEACDCQDLEGDGVMDLSMHFSTPLVVKALQLDDLSPGTSIELVVTGLLVDNTPFSVTDCIRLVPAGDVDGDGTINANDLLIIFANWGACADCNNCPADLDGDCNVNTNDLLVLFAFWGSGECVKNEQ